MAEANEKPTLVKWRKWRRMVMKINGNEKRMAKWRKAKKAMLSGSIMQYNDGESVTSK